MVLATLYRFGYELTVIESTKEKAETALMKEYKEAFINRNGFNPDEEVNDRGWNNLTFTENAKEDIEYRTLKKGVVEWF